MTTRAKPGVEPLLLTTVQVSTFLGTQLLTRASAFFFERDGRLFLVTSRHVLFDEESAHMPDAIELWLHAADGGLVRTEPVRLSLYQDGHAAWRQAKDGGGDVDVAVIELDRAALPSPAAFQAFTPQHLLQSLDAAEVGTPLLLLGFPLGFHDTVYHLPVARHAIVASSFGLRFQGQGYFLTDARAHRGSSGGPLVTRWSAGPTLASWKLLGVHSSRFEMDGRDVAQDERLGLNCAWYADILMTLTRTANPP
jgi:S1-C subfamily serine protease